MRFIATVLLGMTILATPAMATMASADNTSSASSPVAHSFGGLNCPQRVPCPGYMTTMPSSAELAANADSCLTKSFGLVSTGKGFFDPDMGLDSSNCLSYISGSVQQKTNVKISPRCCIAKLADNTCSFDCELSQQ